MFLITNNLAVSVSALNTINSNLLYLNNATF